MAGAEDWDELQALIAEVARACDVHIYAFCLMTNHYHLLLEVGAVPLSKFMRRIQTAYLIMGGDIGIGEHFYAPGVGLVKVVESEESDPIEHELTEYRYAGAPNLAGSSSEWSIKSS